MDTATQVGSVVFAHTGTWYDYLADSTITVNSTTQNFTLAPGEYHVYIDQNASAVLPLQFISVTGNRETTSIRLNWITANESNLLSYSIMRSFNGKDFTDIGSVTASNTAQHTYEFTDVAKQAVNSNSFVYYKIKATDKSGNVSYSSIVRIDPSSANQNIVIYPNPIKNGNVNLQMVYAVAGKVQITIMDATGRIVKTQSVTVTAGNNTASINVSSLSTGIYNVKIVKNGVTTVQKIVVQ